jgi:hypothetical protein
MPRVATAHQLDLSGIPEQPLILKNQVNLYQDNTRKRPIKTTDDDDDDANNNKKKAKPSKYMGVYWENGMSKWHAQIMVKGRVCNLGLYLSEEAAAQVYAKAAFKYKKCKPPTGVYGGLDLSNVPEQPLVERDKNSNRKRPATDTTTSSATTTPKYKGTKRCRNKWQARISINRKMTELGTFDTETEAATVYAKAAYYLEQKKQQS